MIINNVDLPQFISAFGVALFLALVGLLKMQHRRQVLQQARVKRGLRSYVIGE